jgi:hypothetical protein
MNAPPRKPRAKALGEEHEHPIEHGEDVIDAVRQDELVGSTPHLPAPDLRAEEPFTDEEDL